MIMYVFLAGFLGIGWDVAYVCMCMYVCMCVCMYVRMYVYARTHLKYVPMTQESAMRLESATAHGRPKAGVRLIGA